MSFPATATRSRRTTVATIGILGALALVLLLFPAPASAAQTHLIEGTFG